VNVEATAQPLRHDVQMQFTLGGNDRLVEFGVGLELKGRVFAMQSGKSCGNFIFLAPGPRLQRGVQRGLGIVRRRKFHGSACLAQGIPGMGIFEFHRGADVTGSQLADRRAFPTV